MIAYLINSTLYHYFPNKSDLWKKVKEDILNSFFKTDNIYLADIPDPKEFLTEFIKQRFEFYFKNPEIIRLMNWQRLEDHKIHLETNFPLTGTYLIPYLKKFKIQGKILPTQDPEILAHFVSGATTAPIYEFYDQFLKDPTYKNFYLEMITTCIVNAVFPYSIY